ncbi:MAG TPA: VTT domain-containing protein [Pyrinomonadaceae bacterium]|nr:VTT domain-containing protein [Pyrinomonadaceae bacterium]
MQLLLIKYGLVAVFACTAFEADVAPVLTGVVVHFGYFGFLPSIVTASIGAFAGDCAWFWIGRSRSQWIRRRRIYRRAGEAAEVMAQRFGLWQIPASHFIFGTRVATMTFTGIRGVSFFKFAFVDLLACAALTTLLVTLGFGFSQSAALIIANLKKVELLLLPVSIVVAVLLYILKSLISTRLRHRTG